MLRTVLAVVVAPIIWGLVMVPGNQLVSWIYPGAEAGDASRGYLVAALVASSLYSSIAGFGSAWIGHGRTIFHGLLAGVALLAIGVFMQLQYWDALPAWYHLTFLTLLIPACVCGAALCERMRAA